MRALVLGALFLAPLAFGAVHRPALGALTAAAAAAFAWSWRRGCRTVPGAHAFLIAAAVTALQVIPLPRPVLAFISPGSAIAAAGRSFGVIAVSPVESLLALVVLASGFGLASGATHELGGRWRARATEVVVATALAASVVGLIQSATGTRAIYGLWQPRHDWAVYGPYVNANHFAGYVALAWPLALAASAARSAAAAARLQRRRTRRWLALLDPEWGSALRAWAVTAVLALALLDARSRAGVLSALVGTLVWLAASGRRRAAAVLAALLAAAALAAGPRLSAQVEASRMLIWSDALPLVTRFPVLGCGLEGFDEAYRPVQRVLRTDYVHHAHNEYLQAWIELGPAGLAALLAVVGGSIRAALRQGREGAALAGALAAAAAGNLFDFGWHIPANAATWAALAGLATQRNAVRGTG